MSEIYDNLYDITSIPELEGWQLTQGLQIELEERCYHVWKPETDQHMRLIRGTGSCAWGWGALLKKPKVSLLGSMVAVCYPLVGMVYGLKDKLKWRQLEKMDAKDIGDKSEN